MTRAVLRSCLNSARLLLPLALVGIAHGQIPLQVTIRAHDDLNQPIPGVVVRLETPAGALLANKVTNADGSTGYFPLVEQSPLVVTLADVTTSSGIVLGQKFADSYPAIENLPAANVYQYLRTYHQPLALPVFLSTAKPFMYAEPFHDRWDLTTVEQAVPVAFNAHVAMLLGKNEIARYAAYQSISFGSHAGDYSVGVVFKTPEVDMGQGSFVLSVDCAGHGFTQMPIADAFIVTPSSSSGSPTLLPIGALWEANRAHYWIKGKFERGDNVILLRGTAPLQGPTPRLIPSPPSHAMPGTGSPIATQCVPLPPSPPSGWSCVVPAPAFGTNCPVEAGSMTCTVVSDKLAPGECGLPGSGPGGKATFATAIRKGGTVSIGVDFGGFSADVTGTYDDQTISTTEYPFTSGDHNCGTCIAKFVNTLVCAAAFHSSKDKKEWVWDDWLPHQVTFPCSVPLTKTNQCTDSIAGPGTCSQTPPCGG